MSQSNNDTLKNLMNIIPLDCDISIYPNKKYITLEFYDENYCGGLEQNCGNWEVEGTSLKEVFEKAILHIRIDLK